MQIYENQARVSAELLVRKVRKAYGMIVSHVQKVIKHLKGFENG